MGASVKEEPLEPTPPGTPETPLPNPPSVIQPTTPPNAGATSPQYIKLLEDTVREQNRRLQEAATASSVPAASATPKKTAEEERQEFYNDPMNANRRLIREELNATVGPILDFVNQMKGGSLIDNLVRQFKVDPRFSPMWDLDVESYIRQQASTVPPAQLSEQTFGFIVVSAIGMKATGMMLPSSGIPATVPQTPAATPTPAPSVPTPPHMRPSAPASPSAPTGGKPQRTLTEAEERIRRENHMTVEQFLTFQEMPSTEVAFTDFDKPKPRTP